MSRKELGTGRAARERDGTDGVEDNPGGWGRNGNDGCTLDYFTTAVLTDSAGLEVGLEDDDPRQLAFYRVGEVGECFDVHQFFIDHLQILGSALGGPARTEHVSSHNNAQLTGAWSQ